VVTGKVPNETCQVIPAPFLPGTNPHESCPEDHPPPSPTPEESPLPDLTGEGIPPQGGNPEGESFAAPLPAPESAPDGTAKPEDKKKSRGHESIWKRMAREQEEKAARETEKGTVPRANIP